MPLSRREIAAPPSLAPPSLAPRDGAMPTASVRCRAAQVDAAAHLPVRVTLAALVDRHCINAAPQGAQLPRGHSHCSRIFPVV
jgi:hypothetical protein